MSAPPPALLLNLDFGQPPPRKAAEGNAKHQRFVRKRRLLEQRGLLSRGCHPPRKAPRPRADAARSGEAASAAGAGKGPPAAERTAGARGASERPLDARVAVPWLTPAPAPKGGAIAAKIDLLGEFQSALPKAKSLPSGSQSRGPRKSAPQRPAAAAAAAAAPRDGKRRGAAPGAPAKMVAIDCEMVGTGPRGHVSSLARCSIVSYDGDVLYDEYILPPCPIVDYRTRWSGIRKQHMVNATPFKTAQRQILKILAGRIVVGHAIHNDFKALQYFHPRSLTRDTSHIPLLNRKADCPENATVSLKQLTKKLLSRDIQIGKKGHSSVEDAQATMDLYKLVEVEWEQHLVENPP